MPVVLGIEIRSKEFGHVYTIKEIIHHKIHWLYCQENHIRRASLFVGKSEVSRCIHTDRVVQMTLHMQLSLKSRFGMIGFLELKRVYRES